MGGTAPTQTTIYPDPLKPPSYNAAMGFWEGMAPSMMGGALPTYPYQVDPGVSPTMQAAMQMAQGYATSPAPYIMGQSQGALGGFMQDVGSTYGQGGYGSGQSALQPYMSPSLSNSWNQGPAPQYFSLPQPAKMPQVGSGALSPWQNNQQPWGNKPGPLPDYSAPAPGLQPMPGVAPPGASSAQGGASALGGSPGNFGRYGGFNPQMTPGGMRLADQVRQQQAQGLPTSFQAQRGFYEGEPIPGTNPGDWPNTIGQSGPVSPEKRQQMMSAMGRPATSPGPAATMPPGGAPGGGPMGAQPGMASVVPNPYGNNRAAFQLPTQRPASPYYGAGASQPGMMSSYGAPQQYGAPQSSFAPTSQPQTQPPDPLVSVWDSYRAAVPAMESARDRNISEAMAKAGFGGNRFSTTGQNMAAQIGADTALKQNQMLTDMFYRQGQSDLDRWQQGLNRGLQATTTAMGYAQQDRDRALQAAGQGAQLAQMTDQLTRNRLNSLQGVGQWEQARGDQLAQMGYGDFMQSRKGWMGELLPGLTGVPSPTQPPPTTTTQGGSPGFMDYAMMAAQLAAMFGGFGGV